MRWVVGLRTLVLRHPSAAVGLAVFALALAARMPDLGASCNVDAVLYWFGRTRKFWAALGEGRFSEIYYSPHPGVSIMWLSGASLRALGILNTEVTERSVVAATAPLALLASAVPAVTVLLLYRVFTARAPGAKLEDSPTFGATLSSGRALTVAALTGTFLATEPFLVAHARTFQLDATTTGFVWIGTLLGVLALVERRTGFALGAGACFGLAVLTRMLSGTFLLGLGVAYGIAFILERPLSPKLVVLCAAIGVMALATAFLLWPALPASPIETISRVLESSSKTVDVGHVEFSWGKVYSRDPGPAFYGGVMLMRLSPEVLVFALLGLGLVWLSPKRVLVVLAVLACTYLPPAVGLLASAKKADRYALLFFPFITVVASVCLVELSRRVPLRGLVARRAGALFASLAALLLVGRVVRLVAIHPVPIAWCASYPGLRCEDVITLGQGEGFRDAALWINENTPVRRPSILSAYAGGAVLSPWLDYRKVKDGSKAHFVLTYISTEQRNLDSRIRKEAVGKPLHEVRFQGRAYVRIFKGGEHPDAQRPDAKRRRRRRS